MVTDIYFNFRQYAEYVSTQMRETESSVAGKEVRGLPDNVGKIFLFVYSVFVRRVQANTQEHVLCYMESKIIHCVGGKEHDK